MKLILIGMIIGIGKIIPGVSGAMLAISLGVYERALNSITNFFDKPKENLKFLFLLGLGIFLAIILGSKIIIYFLNKFNLMTMMFFIGLIISGVLEYNKNIKYTFKSCLLISTVVLTFVLLSFVNSNNAYVLSNNFNDLIVFFLGGIIEIFSSLVPGISGTALLMILGIYEHTLVLFSSVYDLNYVLKNIQLYSGDTGIDKIKSYSTIAQAAKTAGILGDNSTTDLNNFKLNFAAGHNLGDSEAEKLYKKLLHYWN